MITLEPLSRRVCTYVETNAVMARRDVVRSNKRKRTEAAVNTTVEEVEETVIDANRKTY